MLQFRNIPSARVLAGSAGRSVVLTSGATMRGHRGRLAGLTPALFALGAACASPTDEGAAPPTISLVVVSGGGQTATAGSELPNPLVVKASDHLGKPFKSYLVNFRVTAGGGRMYAGSAFTDANGIARDYWTLGPAVGEQQVDVVAVYPSTGVKQHFGSFKATATAP